MPASGSPLSFNVLLNLASVCNTEDPAVLWGFISRYVPGATPESLRQFLKDMELGYSARSIVVSYETWQRLLGGTTDVVGRTIRVDGEPKGALPRAIASPDEPAL